MALYINKVNNFVYPIMNNTLPSLGRYNNATNPETFASWDNNNITVTADQIAAPDGTLTADMLAETAVSDVHRLNLFPTSGANKYQTFSVYAKYGTREWLELSISDYSGANYMRAWFNIQTGAKGNITTGGNAVGARSSIYEYGRNNWYRCILSGKPRSSMSMFVSIYMASANGAGSYLGDVNKNFYVWGAQLEEGITASPYQRV